MITEFIRNDYQQIITLRQYPKSQPQVVREHHFTHKNGRLIDKTDPLGRRTRYRHSNFSQVSQQTNADGGLLSYQRDRERNLIGIQRDNQTESYNMVYDLVENRIETIGFDARAQQYGFDADNRLQSVMDANERSIQVQRDCKGNILQQSAQHNGQTHNNRFIWDKADKLTQADNAQRNINIEHHVNGLPESIEQGEWRIAKQYDDAARTSELWLPDGDVIGFDYDDSGLSQIRHNEKPLLIFHRDAAGRETLREQANGVELQQAWYPFGELAAQQWRQVNEEAKHTRAYYYNQQQLSKIGDSEQGDTGYAYDAIDQLLQVTGAHPEKFGWDAFGNPQGDDIGVFQDRLGIKGEKRYQHDGSGNQIAVEVESPESGLYEAIEHREFNGFNQLTRFSDEANVTTYEYDALHRRSAKINQHGRADFLWDGPYLIGEVRDGLFTWWIYEPGTFRPLLMIQNGKVYYYHTDHLGTPLKLTDENAEVVWMATYSAFGKATILVEKVKQPLRFPGQYYDEESGLCSNGFRYYDPELGRYITQDPIGLAGGLNPYQYAPNPVMWIDPTGLSCKEALTTLSRQELIAQFGLGIGAGMFASLHGTPTPETPGGLLEALLKPAFDMGMVLEDPTQTIDGLEVISGMGKSLLNVPIDLTNLILSTQGGSGVIALSKAIERDLTQLTGNPFKLPPTDALQFDKFLIESAGEKVGAGIVNVGEVVTGVAGLTKVGMSTLARQGGKTVDDAVELVEDFAPNSSQVTGAFDPSIIKVWPGLGKLEGKQVNISEKGLRMVERHLKNFEIDGPILENQLMLDRLKISLNEGKPLTGADASFYIHEVTEAAKTSRTTRQLGIPYNSIASDYDLYQQLHWGSINKFEVSPYSVYHPDVINQINKQTPGQYPQFDSRWTNFWKNINE